jgi:hypothetical protein
MRNLLAFVSRYQFLFLFLIFLVISFILIYNLIRFKDEFYRISDLKYQPIINELANYAIISDDYEEKFPYNSNWP